MYVLFHGDAVPLARNNTVHAVSVPWLQKPVWQELEMVSVMKKSSPQVIAHISDVQGNLITAEMCQGSLRDGDCTDRRGEEQHEKGNLLLLIFLSAKWSSNRSSSPVSKRWNPKRAANRTTDFVMKVSTFLVPKSACDLSQNDNWLDLGWEGTRYGPVQVGRPSGDSLLYFLMTAAFSG